MFLPNRMQDFQCDLNNVLLNEGFEGFEVHPSSFDFLQCDLSNVFSSGGVENFKVFPQSSNCRLHFHNTMSHLKPPENFKYRFFSSRFVPISGFVPPVVDHVTGEAVAGGCDQPITYTSLDKSTNTKPTTSISGTFGASSSRSVGVEVPNVLVIPTFLETPKKKPQM
jgi:hypothetical protein